jgi:foldase protein PrsA
MLIHRKRTCIASVVTLATAVPTLCAQGTPAVTVNGTPIERQRVIDLAFEARGLEAMQQIIVLELAKQEAQRRKLAVSQADVQRELRDALERIGREAGTEMSPPQQEEALEVMLEEKGVSRAEFMIGMERNAYLRRIAESDVNITEQTLREEFARTFGEKVQVRHIQLDANDLRSVDETLDALKREDFAAVARRLSRNADTARVGGELPPFTFDDAEMPAAMREAAFALSPGQVSTPIRTDNYFHILKLERRIPSEAARFEDVRPQVERRLRDRVVPARMNQLTVELFEQAEIRVIDGELRQKYERFRQRTNRATP